MTEHRTSREMQAVMEAFLGRCNALPCTIVTPSFRDPSLGSRLLETRLSKVSARLSLENKSLDYVSLRNVSAIFDTISLLLELMLVKKI
jgi:hypothetical protein